MVLGNMDVGLNTQNLVAVLVVIFLSVLNVFGVRLGAAVQNVFTFAKTAALLGLVGAGPLHRPQRTGDRGKLRLEFLAQRGTGALHPVQVGVGGPIALVGTITILAVAQVGSLFSADAWNNVTFTAGEVRNPQRNLPLSLAIGTGVVIFLYVMANVVYLTVLPLVGDANGTTLVARGIQHASEDRVATAVMEQIFSSSGAKIMAVLILISGFGCNNGLILAGARVYYAMAKDGLFFKSAAKLHPKYHTPAHSLMMQCVWTCVLCISGSYGQLLDYIIFAVLVFYILTIAGLFVLRVKRPDVPRPYRAIGYPVLPAIYILMAVFIDIVLLRYKPQYTWPGLFIVLLGIPVYFLWSKRSRRANVRKPDLEGETKPNDRSAEEKTDEGPAGRGPRARRAQPEARAGAGIAGGAGHRSDHRCGHLRAVGTGRALRRSRLDAFVRALGTGLRVCRPVLCGVRGDDSAGGQRLYLRVRHAG